MRKILLPVFFIFCSHINFAQQVPKRLRFEHLTVADGLPENSVTCMLRDHLGFMWLGTQNGLVQYDGTKMKSFQYDPGNPFSFMGRLVLRLLEDQNGDIWIGAESLFRFDRASQQFIKYPDVDSSMESSSLIVFMSQDKQGCIWIIKYFKHKYNMLKRFDPKNNEWITYGEDPGNPHYLLGKSVYGEYISNDNLMGFTEDKNGKIWVNTYGDNENTLQWFDRKNDKFIAFHPRLSPGMTDDFKKIGGIADDHLGHLFLTSLAGKGVFELNTDNGQVQQFKHDVKDSNSLVCDTTLTAYVDKFGFVWIPTVQGLDRYDPVKKLFTHYVSRPGDLSTPGSGILKQEYESAEGDIWFAHPDGMSFYSRKNNRFLRYESDEKQTDGLWGSTMSCFVDATGSVWIGSQNLGLNKEVRTNQFSLIKNEPGNSNSLQDANVFSIFEAPSEPGIIWFGTKKGLDRYDKITGRYMHYGHSEYDRNSISKGAVSSVAEDRAGRFWIGTEKGLNLMDRKKGSFIHFTFDSLITNSLSDNYIVFINPVSDGTLWISTAAGLDHFDYDHNAFTHYERGDSSYSSYLFKLIDQYTVSNELVAAIMHPGENVNITVPFILNQSTDLLVTGMGEINGLERDDWGWIENAEGRKIWDMNVANTLRDRRGRVRSEVIRLAPGSYRLRYHSDDGYSYGHWNGPAPLHANLWGIQLRRISNSEIKVFNKEAAKRELNSLSDNYIYSSIEDSKKNIWIGSNNGGLTKFEQVSGKFVSYVDPFKGPYSISGSILEDRETGDFWAGDYIFGLLLIDHDGHIVKRYNTSNSLSGTSVFGLQEDRKGILWLSTDNGLRRFNPRTDQFQMYGEKNNLQGLRFNSMSFCQTSDGEMYFGGPNGVNAFYPDQIRLDTLSPRLAFTDLDIAGKPASLGKDAQMPVHISITKDIQLLYNQNDITFHFTSLQFDRGEESQFAYRLSPNDKDWVQSGSIRQARYTSLSPGTYSFAVKAGNADGVWNEKGIFITFTVLPPWWKTWWAYIIYILAVVGGIFGFISYRSTALKNENKTLEGKVELRTTQLQTSLENLKSTQSQLIQSEKMASLGELTAGIAHEIQNPLNFMNNFSEVNKELIDEMEQELDKGNLGDARTIAKNIRENEEKINNHGKRADAIVKGMMQHSRSNTGAKEPTAINALTDEYLRLSYHGLRARDKSFNATMETDYDQAIGKINIIPQDIGRVLLNLYNNAFYAVSEKKKQLQNGYEPTVAVSTKKINGKVEIRVKDNGNGIPQKVLDKIFQPFFTTKPAGQGTGLGLSLSYDIVKAHAGEIKVETKEGKGTEFLISIPFV